MGERAADRAAVAHLLVGDLRGRARDQPEVLACLERRRGGSSRRCASRRWPRSTPRRPATSPRSTSSVGAARRSFISGISEWPPASSLASSPPSPSGGQRLVDASRARVVELGRDHRPLPRPEACPARGAGPSPCTASHTRIGVSGMSMIPVTPSGRSASSTALVTAGVAAIVPASPTPLTPSELTGDGVSVRSVSKRRQLGRGGQRVVDERAGDQLALLVVDDLLVQRLADRVGDAAVHLAVDQHRVDRRAAVVDGVRSARPRPSRSRRRRRRRTRARRTGRRSSPGRRTTSPRAPARCRPAARWAGCAPRPAISAMVIALSGEPFDAELAVGQLDVLGRRLEQRRATTFLAFSCTFSAARAIASPPTAREREP